MAYGVYPILNVADLDRSRAFYKGLGLKTRIDEMPMGPGMTMRWLTVDAGGDHALMLFLREFPGADPADVAWASGEVGKGVLLNIGVPNAKRVEANARKMGVAVEAADENPWGGRFLQLADPDGYYLMITDRFPPEGGPKKRAKAGARKGAKRGGRKAKAPAKKGRKAAKKAKSPRRR